MTLSLLGAALCGCPSAPGRDAASLTPERFCLSWGENFCAAMERCGTGVAKEHRACVLLVAEGCEVEVGRAYRAGRARLRDAGTAVACLDWIRASACPTSLDEPLDHFAWQRPLGGPCRRAEDVFESAATRGQVCSDFGCAEGYCGPPVPGSPCTNVCTPTLPRGSACDVPSCGYGGCSSVVPCTPPDECRELEDGGSRCLPTESPCAPLDCDGGSCDWLDGALQCLPPDFVPVGAPCSPDGCFHGFCERATQTCARPLATGAPCLSSSLCADPQASCQSGVCAVQPVGGVEEGEACDPLVCAAHLVCRSSVCVRRAGVGEACASQGASARRLPCELGSVCSDRWGASDSRCFRLPAAGEHCSAQLPCLPLSWCGPHSVCERLKVAGDACGSNLECYQGACSGGRCASLKAPGERCTPAAGECNGACTACGTCP